MVLSNLHTPTTDGSTSPKDHILPEGFQLSQLITNSKSACSSLANKRKSLARNFAVSCTVNLLWKSSSLSCNFSTDSLKYIKVKLISIGLPDVVGLFSGTVLNVQKHIFERKHRKSFGNFSSIVNK